MRRYEIVQRAAYLREVLDNDFPTVNRRRPSYGRFDFDPSETGPFIAYAKWQLKHMPRNLTACAEILGEIRGTLIGTGLYGHYDLPS